MGFNGKHIAEISGELDTILTRVAERAQLPSLCVDVDISGVSISKAYRNGPFPVFGDERPVYGAGCMLDSLLALLALILERQGLLDFDHPVSRWLPEFEREDDARFGGAIKVGHLMSRTSGIQDPRSLEEMASASPWSDLGPRMRKARRLFSPGETFNYGGVDRVLLAEIIERACEMSIAEATEVMIGQPCGIIPRPQQYAVDELGNRIVDKIDTYSSLVVSRRFMAETRANLAADGAKSLSKTRSVKLSKSVKVYAWAHAPIDFTDGLFRYSDGFVGFNGWDSNQSCAVRSDPVEGVSFIVGMDGPPAIRDVIIAEIAECLGYSSPQSPAAPCTVGSLNGVDPGRISGRYLGWAEGYEAEVSLEGQEVVCNLSYKADQFRRIRVALDADGWMTSRAVTEVSALEFFEDAKTGQVCLASGFLPYAQVNGAG